LQDRIYPKQPLLYWQIISHTGKLKWLTDLFHTTQSHSFLRVTSGELEIIESEIMLSMFTQISLKPPPKTREHVLIFGGNSTYYELVIPFYVSSVKMPISLPHMRAQGFQTILHARLKALIYFFQIQKAFPSIHQQTEFFHLDTYAPEIHFTKAIPFKNRFLRTPECRELFIFRKSAIYIIG
jgi:hypothetical protein